MLVSHDGLSSDLLGGKLVEDPTYAEARQSAQSTLAASQRLQVDLVTAWHQGLLTEAWQNPGLSRPPLTCRNFVFTPAPLLYFVRKMRVGPFTDSEQDLPRNVATQLESLVGDSCPPSPLR